MNLLGTAASDSVVPASSRGERGRLGSGLGETRGAGGGAGRLGVSDSMVRSWERLWLTQPARSRSKYRLYSNDDLRVLRRALYLRRVQGLNAPAIRSQLRQEGLLNRRATSPAAEQSSIGPRFRRLRLQRG